jgi:hypothetical protein
MKCYWGTNIPFQGKSNMYRLGFIYFKFPLSEPGLKVAEMYLQIARCICRLRDVSAGYEMYLQIARCICRLRDIFTDCEMCLQITRYIYRLRDVSPDDEMYLQITRCICGLRDIFTDYEMYLQIARCICRLRDVSKDYEIYLQTTRCISRLRDADIGWTWDANIAVSSAKVAISVTLVVGTPAVYIRFRMHPRILSCGTPDKTWYKVVLASCSFT